MFGRKYFLDEDLQYKKVKLPWKLKFLRIFLFLAISIIMGIIYKNVYAKNNETLDEHILTEQIEQLKLDFDFMNKRLNNSLKSLECLYVNDNDTYRIILSMDSIEKTFDTSHINLKNYEELEGYENTQLMVSSLELLNMVMNKVIIQTDSHKKVQNKTEQWIHQMAHLPIISPVHREIRKGDGIKFREKHPVLGTPQWHHGQDFSTPHGTEIFATGAGTIKSAGWDDGLGNYVIINHGYGYESIYGHLSKIAVKKGDKVKRGDMIGLSGSTGWSTGPHLHYQINLYGKYQNPLFFFNDDLTPDEYFAMIDTLTARFKI